MAMELPKLLFIEDDKKDLDTFQSTITRYYEEKKDRHFNIIYAESLEDAIKKLDFSFDGAIIDLKLKGNADAGNEVIDKIIKDFRIPIVVFTGTPENVGRRDLVEIFKKGEIQYDVILDKLFEIYQTGLTKIFGGRGHLEDTMNKVFWGNIIPVIDTWKKYCIQGKQTEQALLRYTINHMIEVLDNENEFYFPEEMYIAPPISNEIKTGSIVKIKQEEEYFVVLSPSCDLVIHNGNIKTERIMICAIENLNMDLITKAKEDVVIQITEEDDGISINDKSNKKTKAKNMLDRLQRNSYCFYYHFLPKTEFYPGGFVNFRKIETYKPSEFMKKFEKPLVQISSAFVKDIIGRMSTYYARQGQPDFDFDSFTL